MSIILQGRVELSRSDFRLPVRDADGGWDRYDATTETHSQFVRAEVTRMLQDAVARAREDGYDARPSGVDILRRGTTLLRDSDTSILHRLLHAVLLGVKDVFSLTQEQCDQVCWSIREEIDPGPEHLVIQIRLDSSWLREDE